MKKKIPIFQTTKLQAALGKHVWAKPQVECEQCPAKALLFIHQHSNILFIVAFQR